MPLPVSVTLLVNSESAHKRDAAAKIAAALSTSALQVSIAAVPWSEFVARLKSGNFDLYYGEYKMTADWDLTELLTGSCNYGRYAGTDLTALLAAERTAQGSAHDTAAAKLYAAFQAQMPFAPICFERSSVLTISGVIQGLTPLSPTHFIISRIGRSGLPDSPVIKKEVSFYEAHQFFWSLFSMPPACCVPAPVGI